MSTAYEFGLEAWKEDASQSVRVFVVSGNRVGTVHRNTNGYELD
jgi:hypothetical protein